MEMFQNHKKTSYHITYKMNNAVTRESTAPFIPVEQNVEYKS